MMIRQFSLTAMILAVLTIALPVRAADDTVSDPIEPVNRAVFSFNRYFDKFIFKPVAKTYKYVVPADGQDIVGNVLGNLNEPVTFVNSAFQGDFDNATHSFWRFTVNSTWGIGGLFDVAKEAGLTSREEDFGQTLGHYGVGHGAYLMLPILGPSSLRDGVGKAADSFAEPINYVDDALIVAAEKVVYGIHTRAGLLKLIDDVEATSFDPYAAFKSLYIQHRAALVENRK
jgi:phospholipid-binding lipoprotein MlaA